MEEGKGLNSFIPAALFRTNSVPGWLRHGWAAALDFLLPPRCLTCDTPTASHDGLCGQCWGQLRFITEPYCRIYGTPFVHDLGEEAVSARAISEPPVFARARAALAYSGPAREMVTGLKFGRRRELAAPMARLMRPMARNLLRETSLIVPVPLHPLRRIARRFNQSADLARLLARDVPGTFDPSLLLRLKATRQQVGLLADARQRNVRNAFEVPAERQHVLQGRHVVLVDDVLTTGATVSACARALKKAGADDVDVLVFAMALQNGEETDLMR